MKSSLIICLTMLFAGVNVFSQAKFQTIAEKSNYSSTSDYDDVMTFIDRLVKTSPFIRIENIATSVEGRNMPLLVIGNPLPKSPADLTDDKRIVVYVQANIHAGEVEGKEATLMFARDLLKDKNPELLKDVVLLICPLFNPDGNEKISPLNRTYQNGPVNGVGVRYNGQYLDLNRDAIKAESPEVRGVLANVFNRWDPAVFMDCHTTNGSYHIEPVTFTWMVNPNGNASLISYMRDRMMPEMSKTLFNMYKVENCFYGEFIDMMDPDKGWILDASEPRYMSNYYGIRNRLGILNENYVYADFKSRVLGCYYLIHSLLDYASIHKSEIKNLLHEVDSTTIARGYNPSVTDSFAIEYQVRATPDKVTVKTFESDLISDANGRRNYVKSERRKDVTIPYYIDYFPVKSVRLPFAYIININDPEITDLLKIHGIKIEKLANDSKIKVERFDISELKGTQRLNQGHYTDSIKGKYVVDTLDFPAGTMLIRTAQPLANVVSYLLEPQSNDGLVIWNFLDRYLVPQWGNGYNSYPVYKVMDRVDLKTAEMK
jgi:murein tripeptide amidase MpaA